MAGTAKNPSAVIFWNDLENDQHLRTCSLAAKGLWDHHMLPIAARSIEPGVVILGNHPSIVDGDLPALLARTVGELPDVIVGLLRELIDSGAASVDAKGRVYNRRMAREEATRKAIAAARSKAGKRGAEAKKQRKQTPSKPQAKPASKAEANGYTFETLLTNGNHLPIQGETASQDQASAKQTAQAKVSLLHSSVLQSSKNIGLTTGVLSHFEDSEPVADHGVPEFLNNGTPIASSIDPDWLPSASAQDELAKARPDLTPEIVQTRMVEFRNWCAEKATQTHNPDATWFSFMRRTHVQQHTRREQGKPTELDGVAAAFARRSVPPR